MKTCLRMVLIFGFLFLAGPGWTTEAVYAAFDNTAYETGNVTACAAPPANMVAWWPGDNSAVDSVGGNNGTLIDGATYAPGMTGQAFSLDGGGYVAVLDGIIPSNSRYFTVEAWVFPTDTAGAHVIFYGGAEGGEYQIQVGDGNLIFYLKLQYSSWQGVGGAPINAHEWTHVAGVRNGNQIQVWTNGVLRNSATIPEENLHVFPGWNSSIGSFNRSTAFFNGLIDEVGLFDRALSAPEIAAIYNAGSAGLCKRPAAPSNLKAATASLTRIDLAWKDNSTNETGFKLERKAGACGSRNPWVQIAKPSANAIAFPNTGLTANTQYSFKIRAYNAVGNSAYSNCATATAAASTPLAPTALTAVGFSATRIDLAWKDNSTNETGFKLERKAGTCGSTNPWAQITQPGANVTTYKNTGLTAKTKYSYRIRAYNASGDSAYSNCATAITVAPEPPKIISITPNYGKVGETVALSGSGFGATQSASTVTFNGTIAAAAGWSDTSIVVKVPKGATTGNVVVTVNGVQSNGVVFTVSTDACGATVMMKGREWQKCGSKTGLGWNEANTYCTDLVEGGYDDWALPSLETLRDLIVCSNGTQVTYGPGAPRYDDTGNLLNPAVCGDGNPAPYTSPTIDPAFTTYGDPYNYWSSTTVSDYTGSAWAVYFNHGRVDSYSKTQYGMHARCVRSGDAGVPPVITSLSPTRGNVGATVTINGTGFGAVQSAGTVTFNGTVATVSSWSDTTIVVKVPKGATTGNVVARVNNVDSAGTPFAVNLRIFSRSREVCSLSDFNFDLKPFTEGGSPPYIWVNTMGSLPPGSSLDPYTGKITGPRIYEETYQFTIEVSDGFDKDIGVFIIEGIDDLCVIFQPEGLIGK